MLGCAVSRRSHSTVKAGSVRPPIGQARFGPQSGTCMLLRRAAGPSVCGICIALFVTCPQPSISLTADRSSAATAAATALLQSAPSTRSNVPKGRAMEAGAWTLRVGCMCERLARLSAAMNSDVLSWCNPVFEVLSGAAAVQRKLASIHWCSSTSSSAAAEREESAPLRKLGAQRCQVGALAAHQPRTKLALAQHLWTGQGLSKS